MAYAVALEVWKAAHQAVYDLIFSSTSSSDGAALVIYDAQDAALATFSIDPYASGVDPATGDLELVPFATPVTAGATGTASYAQLEDDTGTPLMELPCTQGNTALPGECVLNTLSLIKNGEVEALSIVLPAGDLLV